MTVYLPQLSQMREIFVSILPEFPKNFRQLSNIAKDGQTTSELAEDFRMCSDDFQKVADAILFSLLFRTETRRLAPFTGYFWWKLN